MREKLYTILQEALHTRLTVTGKRLANIDFMQLDTDSRIAMARWLIVCRYFSESLSILQSLAVETLPAPLQEYLFSIQLRLWLLNIVPDPPYNTTFCCVRWVTAQQRSNTDIAYPTSIAAIYITQDRRKELLPVLSIPCPACQTSLEISLRSDIIPFGTAQGTWICPHCLALRDWNADSIKQDCVRQYAAIIQNMPRNTQGKLSDVDAWQAYILAQKLRPLLHIALEGIPFKKSTTPDYIVPYACLPHQALLEYIRVSAKKAPHEEKRVFFNKSDYIQYLTEVLQANPFNESVVLELQKTLSTPFYKEFYTKYLQCIQQDAIPPRHVKKRSQHDTRPLRISFFAGADNQRILRLALTAKTAGYSVQVIIQTSTPLEAYAEFDSVIYFESIFVDMQRIAEAIESFDADCVHAVIQMHVNLLLVALLLTVKVPVIGDAYDMVNVQYQDFVLAHLPYEKRLERLWLEDIDGLCMRAPYLGLMKKAGIRPKRIPVATVYDPLIPERCHFPQKLRESDGKFHIMVLGFHRAPAEDTESIEQLLPYLVSCNVQVHMLIVRNPDNIISTLHKQYLQKYNCITYHDKMPYPAYMQLLGSMDMLMECQNALNCPIEVMGYTPSSVPFHFPNKNCDCIENNVIRYIPECMTYSKWFCNRAGIGVKNSDIEVYTTHFWKNIIHNKSIDREQYKKNIIDICEYTNNRLLNLYKKSLYTQVSV